MPLDQLSGILSIIYVISAFKVHPQTHLDLCSYPTYHCNGLLCIRCLPVPVYTKRLWFDDSDLYHPLHLLLSLAISLVNCSAHCFPCGYSCFLDVDFPLITQTVRHSVNCQGLNWPVGLMRQLIRALIGFPSEGGKDFIGTKIWGQHSIHFSNQPTVLPPSFPFPIWTNSSQKSFNMDYTAWCAQW